jgi:hypothetical protein
VRTAPDEHERGPHDFDRLEAYRNDQAAVQQLDVNIDLAIVRARIERLQHRAAMFLARLEERRGAERHESLRWLVWQLCDLYHYETGRRVTILFLMGRSMPARRDRRLASLCWPRRNALGGRQPG